MIATPVLSFSGQKQGRTMTIFTHCPGPQEDPNECGTPILCVFYGLLAFIVVLTAYTTLCRGDLR